jgi:hypothetical protein
VKASKFFKLKQKWSVASSKTVEVATDTLTIINQIVEEEVNKPIENLIEEVKTTIKKKKKNETIT